jgi:hypothetical protein
MKLRVYAVLFVVALVFGPLVYWAMHRDYLAMSRAASSRPDISYFHISGFYDLPSRYKPNGLDLKVKGKG